MFGNVFRDMLFLMVMGFAFLVVWMLPHINPPTKEDDSEPPGNIIAHIEWPTGDVDVDMWLTGPREIRPVGYSNKSGVLWNLLRDDLGGTTDITASNYEDAFTRGIEAGEYIINVHCYRCPTGDVPVVLVVSLKKTDEKSGKTPTKIIASTKVTLKNHQEVTALRLKLTKDGDVVPNSLNHIYRRLRARATGGMSGGFEDR